MTRNKDRKALIRARMVVTGESYTEAARHIGTSSPGPSPAGLAERGVAAARARVAAYPPDDHSYEASAARRELAGVEEWERRRDGRPVRLWAAIIETRSSALDEDDAYTRLGIYLRHPWHRTGASPLLYGDWPWRLTGSKPARPGVRDCLDQLDPARLSAAGRRRLELDYPLAALGHPRTGEPYSPLDDAHVQDYLGSLYHAAQRLLGQLTGDREAELEERRQLPAGTQLTFWRCCQLADFLAGYDRASAMARAAELAATIVDYAGRPAARVVEIEPEDGFVSAVDGLWCHPADQDGYQTRALFDDYDLAEHSTGDPAAIAAVLEAARTWLAGHYQSAAREHQAFEAQLHTQPDGTRTLSTPAELAAVAAAARAKHRRKSPAELRGAADFADHMANRVYGKSVESDADFKRIERAQHEARTLRELASELECRGDPRAPVHNAQQRPR